MEKSLQELISTRNALAMQQQKLFINTIERINMGNRELLQNDLGSTLVKNIGRDLAGEVVKVYFDFGDYYITVDQMIERFIHFSYNNDQDFLMNDGEIRKAVLNKVDSVDAKSMKKIVNDCQDFQTQLFTEERSNDKFDRNGKRNYKNSKVQKIHDKNGQRVGILRDELSGRKVETTTKPQNKNDWYSKDLQADHKIAREVISINDRYIKNSDEIRDKYREFYNSNANMQMILAAANQSKGDVRVCNINGDIKYLNPKSKEYDPATDITMKATPEQLTEAFVHQLENADDKTKKSFKKGGYLGKDGKVKEEVKENYKKNMAELAEARNRQLGDLEDFNYRNMAKDAKKETDESVKKIIVGQLIYYIMPPVIYETQHILRKKNMNIDKFFSELKKSGKRIISYIKSKKSDIIINTLGNSAHKFFKVFFDIVIEMAKETVKRMVRMIKDVVLSLVNCCKILVGPDTSASQKADAITKIMFTTINTIVLEIFFEYLKKKYKLNGTLMEALQVIVTIISTNVIMLILNEMDLFNVRYGLLKSNIEKLFLNENEKFMQESTALLSEGYEASNEELQRIETEIAEIMESIQLLDIKKDDAVDSLDNINKLFCMGIDFEEEWRYFSQREVFE